VSVANDAVTAAAVEADVPAPVYLLRLSVINGGLPRDSGQTPGENEALPAGTAEPFAESRPELDRSHFQFADQENTKSDATANDGTSAANTGNSLPIAGDFDGDGDSETGIFRAGEWFIDLNGNGVWDRDDLWARLGEEGDQPIVGDWDGDGKDDIGVYGQQVAVNVDSAPAERGLPDANNDVIRDDQNDTVAQTGRPVRFLKRGADGDIRSDAVEHVLNLNTDNGLAVAGDFNGDGIDTVAIFRDGHWTIDVNGDGQITDADVQKDFGQAGDQPVAGDFDGDGIDEVGIYRDGNWLIAIEKDGEATTTEFQLGGPGRLPVVGDFDGDGRDDAAVYRNF
jgi:hypothetical protein